MTTEKIVEMVKNLLMGPFFDMGTGIWNFVMSLVFGVVTTTPQGFSADAWAYVVNNLYPWALGIGVALLNLFFLIGFFKQTANIKENMTTEILVTLLVKLIMANTLMTSGLNIMQQFFEMSSGLSAQVFHSPPSFSSGNVDMQTMVFFWGIYGMLYMVVAVVCSVMIFLTVYGRFLKLYVAIVTGPVAMSTMAGGIGIENTAHSWIKTFLSYVFEIVIIAIVISIAGKIIGGMDWGRLDSYIGHLFNGASTSFQSMFTMVIMAGSVKGTDSLMRRLFGL